MKTKFESYCNKDIAEGCKFCIRGEKLVLFMGGKCSRKCWYCSLSVNRKDTATTYANERPIKTVKDVIEEAHANNAKGAGITGGDPLVYFEKTLCYATALKKEFGEKFHNHIYLPLPLVDEKKLLKLKTCVDEVRFHPTFLAEKNDELKQKEFEKIKMASKIFGVENTGIEVPMIPEKKDELYEFIKNLDGIIGFANLNEFELSETNFKRITEEYALNEDTYTVRDSITVGRQLVRKAINDKLKINVHLCTAKTKDCYQYINRLLMHDILPYGNRTDEGTVVYFAVEYNKPETQIETIKKYTKNFYDDTERKRFLIEMDDVEKLYDKTDLKIARIEEHPTWGNERLEYSLIGE
ncbi:radical SAM protein [Candidatus Pacearchaeota archaeon]|nr:radical SAM protein [Candidatus Pacearchaeota archaeon]